MPIYWWVRVKLINVVADVRNVKTDRSPIIAYSHTWTNVSFLLPRSTAPQTLLTQLIHCKFISSFSMALYRYTLQELFRALTGGKIVPLKTASILSAEIYDVINRCHFCCVFSTLFTCTHTVQWFQGKSKTYPEILIFKFSVYIHRYTPLDLSVFSFFTLPHVCFG